MGVLGGEQGGGGVAYAAHIGGFAAGLLLIKLFDRAGKRNTVLNSYSHFICSLSVYLNAVFAVPLRLEKRNINDQRKRLEISLRKESFI